MTRRQELLERIAQQKMGIGCLTERKSELDFVDVGVVGVSAALNEAYELGQMDLLQHAKAVVKASHRGIAELADAVENLEVIVKNAEFRDKELTTA